MSQELKVVLEKIDLLSDQIKIVDQKLSHKIDAVDKKLSDRIDAVDKKVSSLEERLSTEIGQVKTAVMEMSEDIEAVLDMYKEQHLRLHKLVFHSF